MSQMGIGILLVAASARYAAYAAWRHGNDQRDGVALAVSGAAIGLSSTFAFTA